MRAAKRMGVNWLKEYQGGEAEFIFNIEPCDFAFGTKWSALWHIDNLGIGDKKYYNYEPFDTVFTADLSSDPKATLLLQALDPELHRRLPEIPQAYDFVICGSMGHVNQEIYKGRNLVYAELKKHFTFYEAGNHHKPDEYIRRINHAKVQFIHSMEVGGRGELAQRFFECLGIGPVLTNWCKELEYTGLIDGQDYWSYKTINEALYKMRILLGNEHLRNKMAKSGRTAALLYHSYEQRLGAIFNIAKQYG